ncbi:MAG TPA: amino acid adenylation domain-containing protein, partial [Thermoanaerobaculia bacterium]|nr:amino acid adenylation domain-containing protein [Thermoanaerobaculia bacterium]
DAPWGVSEPLPGNLAYVLYTSGSTGRPKAVAVEHRSAAALVDWAGGVFAPAELDGVLASTSIAFDLSVFELFVPLSYGGRVVLVPDALHLPSTSEVTLVNTVPSVLAELLRADGLPASVRVVNLAGEPLPASLVEEAYARPSVERVLNLYGPSEDTTYSTWAEIPRGERSPSIGRPVAGTRVHLLDPALRPVPAGVAGELCLAGAGLARGYLGRPELTAERFVPDPFGTPGSRLYRTGDLARRRPDGEIEYLGRRDHQVKVRGFRIELGEVEAALRRHPEVRDAAVVVHQDAHQDRSGDRRLVACWVPREEGREPAVGDFRAFLKESLPEAMLPSAFLALPALPLTPNGKVDRQALARLDPRPRRAPSEPGEETLRVSEELVAGIWREVLELPAVGRDESFFALGGHSLLATRVTSRLREVFGVELPVRALFEAPTVRELARAVETTRGQGLAAPAIRAVPRGPRDRPLPLSFAQERLWFLDRLEPGSAVYNMPAALGLRGGLDVPALAASFREIARRHEPLRTSFPMRDGQPVQAIAPALSVPLPVIDLAALPGETRREEAERRLAAEAARPFDLAAGPLLRTTLLRLEPREHVLAINLHHAVADGWSIGIFVRELSLLYAAAVTGEGGLSRVLPPLPVQYADFAVWQRGWLAGGALQQLLDGWRARLQGAPAALELPADRPRPQRQTFRGGRVGVRLGEATVSGLRALGLAQGATLFMTLLAGFQALLQRYSGQDDVVVGTPVAGRNREELEGLIGLFLNTLPMRGDLCGEPSFRELLGRVREASLDAYALQDLPFEKLVAELAPARDLSRPPLFQTMLVLQNAPMGNLELPGLELAFLPAEAGTAKLELLLSLTEGDGAVEGFLEFNADLFELSTVERLAGHLENLLQAAVADPDVPVTLLPLIGVAEAAELAALVVRTPLHLLDRHLRPVPVGVPGDVWLGGIHPGAKASDRCAPDPSIPGAWLYRTDETARRRADGTLEILARRSAAVAAPAPPAIETRAPTTTEDLVAGVWREVLDLDGVGPEESFFDLGGHSLLAMRVLSRLRQLFGVDLEVRALFEEPTVAGLSRRIEAARGGAVYAVPQVLPIPRGGRLPLSFAQERLWFLDRLAPGGSLYNMPFALRLRGALEPARLDAVLSEVVRRHEALRTTFDEPDGQPVQIVAPPSPFRLPLVDLTVLSGDQAEAERLASEEARRPFDLQRGPLLRGVLLWLGGEDHVLLLDMHHIVSDGWSLGVLVGEVSALYRASLAGEPSPLPELPFQYADFAVWQREWLGEEGMDRQLAYWRERLAGAPTTLDLPADRPRPIVQSFRGGRVGFLLGPETIAGLRRLGATLFMALLGGTAALLQRLTGQDDLVIGTPIANRNHLATERLIGFFVNSLALRLDLADDLMVGELLEQARETALAAYDHQDLPFERLVEELRPERHLSHHPIFQVMLTLQNAPGGAADLPGLSLEPFEFAVPTAKFDLALTFQEVSGPEGEALLCTLGYTADLFDAPTAQRLAGQLVTLLEGLAAAESERRISGLPLLTEPEGHQLALEWNDTRWQEAPTPVVTLHGLVEAQARLRPDAVAFLDDGEALSYGELVRRADRLAAGLAGLEPEERVGIRLPNGCERVIALLGVLRAGGAYVPLDPSYPAERLAFLIEDSGVRTVLTSLDVPAGDGPFTPPPVLPDQLAYVIHTSGSTGAPNGVMITHRGAVSFVVHGSALAGLEAGARLPQIASFGFDASVLETFLILANGGALVRVPEEERLAPGELAERLVRHEATALSITPALLATLPEPRLRGVRHLYVGGDACPADLPLRWAPGRRFYNCYGPTETTVFVLTGLYDLDGGAAAAPPLGRPIGNARVYAVDRGLRQVPAGVSGELVIGGPGLARGYLGRPARTAERFVPDPFGEPGGRLYRTGDLVRQLPDGRFEFLGRIDSQVKLRGIRIETGEVEAALARHPAVREVVVTAREDAAGKRLVAYVVRRGEVQGEAETAAEHVETWRTLYDETYGGGSEFTGWNSSYTGLAIPEEEMREWADATVARILALRPRRVLEIGCGTGILLRRVAPHVELYHGTDFSRVALDRLRPEADSLGVTLEERAADDWSGIEPGGFDLVVLNSVSQYFPGVEYLVRVLRGAVRAVASDGAVFVGDVRSLPLLEAFAVSVELAGSLPTLPVAELRRHARRRAEDEEELVVDPALFFALAGQRPEVRRVEVLAKRGHAANEMNRFRYDVVLRAGSEDGEAILPWTDWISLDELERRLATERPEALALSAIPNARLAAETATLDLLTGQGFKTVLELQRAIANRMTREAGAAIDPEALCELGERYGYEVELTWSDPGEWGGSLFSAVLRRPGIRARPAPPLPIEVPSLPWSAWANDPLNGKLARRLVPELRRFLKDRLPEYMVPSAFVLLDELPLTPHGKVDRAALPVPEAPRAEAAYRAPRNPIETELAEVWAELLGAERVGVLDNFFDLGGHSLLATQVISRVRDRFGVELPVRALFEEPTVAGLAARVREEKPAADTVPIEPIVPLPRDGSPLPLSFAQERLWFLDRLEPGSPAYHLPVSKRLEGDLDVPVLTRALLETVRRHEALRTTFVEVDGRPAQVVAPAPQTYTVPLVDLSALERLDIEALRVLQEVSMRPFDLGRGPLLRPLLLRLAPGDHVVLLAMHHIVGDGWSLDVLIGEMTALYAAFQAGRPSPPSPLPPLRVQYADYAVWQRRRLRPEVLAEQEAFWRETLAGVPPLELPTDRPRPPVPTWRGDTVALDLPPELGDGLTALARSQGATRFMALLAVWAAVLGRWAGQEDVPVGSPFAGRDRAEIEPLIGFFTNTLVLRVELAGAPGLRELLGRVRRTALAAFAHQDLPFARVVEAVQPERDLARSPLFQAMFGLHTSRPAGGTSLPGGLTMGSIGSLANTAKFDVSLFLTDDGRTLSGPVEYSLDLFDPATMERLAGRFRLFLDAALREPERPVADLPFLTPAERGQLAEWNDTAADFPDLPVHRLVEEQAARTPDAVAVVFEGEALTYAALNARANRLARHLLSLGAGPEARVAVSLERSLDLPAALLAVLKAGAVFLPLDPGHPPARRRQVIEDAGAKALVTLTVWPALPPQVGGVSLVDLEMDREAVVAWPENDLTVGIDPASLAYVLYTSGSTGRPKGVQVPHRALFNLIHTLLRWTGFGPADVLLAVTTPAFDIALVEMLLPLAAGGRVAVAPREAVTDGTRLAGLLRETGATVMQATPATWRLLLEAGWEGKERALLMTGGEALPRDLADRLLARGRGLWNLYGPTETAVYATGHRVGWGEEPVPIGSPLPNTQGWVLDRRLQPVPPGAVGELYAGGVNVARGYLGQPDRTAESFLPDPFSGEPGARLYRTGDLARQRADGAVAFLGRADQQIKLRGFRIEPGEVEAALERLPEVRRAAVAVRGPSLTAWVVPEDGDVDPGALRRALREVLPDYMVPSLWVILPALPLTPSGKVDRRALPAPGRQESGLDGQEPRTPVEELIAGIWCEVLERDRVATGESFFDLGGHSLLATRVIALLHEVFGVELGVRALFEAPTIADLAQAVEATRAGGRIAPPIRPVPRTGDLPLSFAQERLWFLDQMTVGRAVYNLPFGVRLTGGLDVPALAACLTEVVRRHEALRTRFAFAGEPVQRIDPPFALPLSCIDLSALPEPARGEEAMRRMAAEAERAFDLAAGPVLHAVLLRLDPADHALLVTLHHIVSDGWSIGVLVRELTALYPAAAAGQPSPLPELPVQYADYAVWQREWLAGGVLERQLGYWRERLAGAPAVLALPLDHPRPAVPAFRGARRAAALPDAVLADLGVLARHAGATLFMTLLAAWKALLSRITGEQDVVVGTPVANRQRPEVQELIGFFANTLALRTGLGGDPAFPELLARVRDTALGAYDHQDLPFERLVGELVPERNLRHAPLFQVMFVLDETPPTAPDLPGLAFGLVGAESRTARFDLTLSVQRGSYGAGLQIGYNTDLFRDDTAERLLGSLQRLLEGVVATPERRLSELPLLSEAERHQLLLGWNDTARDLGAGALLHELFERWAAETPDAVAAVFDDLTVTYGELDRRAGGLAARLGDLGVGADDKVGILLPRSIGLAVAILGVLKAGGAWVPLDPAHPEERRALTLRDAGARVLVTEEMLESPRDAPRGVSTLGGGDRDALAYVIYTSGSTGTPNGVMVTHRNAVDRLRAAREMFAVTPESRVVQVLSPGFDASVMEFFLALAHGACLCFVPDEERLTPHALAATLERHGATVAVLTPAVLSLWPEERLGVLGALSVGGEPFPADLAARWAPGRRVLNVYGPTEATIFASSERVHGDEAPPIGRPAANTRIYVLDRALHPVPAGVAGEIAVGGVGVARGYLGNPDKTAERFIPDPWSGAPGARLYRTGDLARLLPDGRLEFLGRIDDQVKVRGFRIEPGEVEAALRLHPSVMDAAVLVRDKELVGYVVLAEETGLASLRPFLEGRLPVYMVPSRLVALPALPVTPNGKVDRRALSKTPLPGEGRAGRGRTEPNGPVERFVADLFKEVLRLDAIGLEESFFELGGTSLQAAILINLLQERLGEYVYVVALFDAPSAAELAVYLEREYPAAAARLRGETAALSEEEAGPVTPEMLDELRRIVPPLPPGPVGPRNRRAVFILSPPRSGSTLLRVLLAGHPDLFAPPELELLGFNTLGERRDAFSGRYAFWREGAVRAWMEARGVPAEEAFRDIEEREAVDLPVRSFYREMQELIGDRLLIDKTPSYALDPATLARAEEDLEEPLYIHLLRQPYGMIASFEKAHLEQVFFRHPHPFTSRRLAELIWTVSHQNIQEHLERVPPGRRHAVRFEDLVRDPRGTLERLCAFLGVELDPAMLDPYEDKQRKMTDGVHELSRMMGDVRFHEHQRIDPEAAESWRSMYEEDFLGEPTREMADSLGYEARSSKPAVLVPLRPGEGPPLFLVHPVGGNILCYGELARHLRKVPAYGLQAAGLEEGREPQETVEEMAECYLDAVRRAVPRGPYRLAGWSFGGLVAFEMARRLSAEGEMVEKLVLLDSPVPGAFHLPEPADADLLAGLALDLGGLAGVDLGIRPADLKGLDAEKGLARILERARDIGALPPGVEAGAFRLWRVYRANARAARAYRPQPYEGRMVVLAAEANPLLGRLGLALGWQRFAAGVAAKTLPADHYGLLRPPVVQQIAEKLSV